MASGCLVSDHLLKAMLTLETECFAAIHGFSLLPSFLLIFSI